MTKREMPKFTKAPEELVNSFTALLKDYKEIELRKMFGYPAGFISGQMCISLFQSNMIIRLKQSDRAQFIETYKTKLFEPMPNRPMKEYVVVPTDLIDKKQELKKWINKSIEYVGTLPAKIKKNK